MYIEQLLSWLKEYKDGIEVITWVVGGICTVIAAFRALRVYRESKEKEAAEWLHGLFQGFYLDPEFRRMRMLLEYDDQLSLVLKKDRDEPEALLTDREKAMLTDLDSILNYFEFMLYLEKRGQLKQEDRGAMFTYWFKLLNEARRESLRHYLKKYHYNAICETLSLS